MVGESMGSINIQQFGLGAKLDTRRIPDNPWPSVLEIEARQLIANFSPEPHVPFAMTESLEVQALASFDPPLILVSGGLVEVICRFSARLVDAGVFVDFGDAAPTWNPSPIHHLKPVRAMIADEPFSWAATSVQWKHEPERLQLFTFLAVSIHRFVVLHELGHIVFRHGARGSGKNAPMVDGETQNLDVRAEAVASQARELAADAYALNSMLRLFDAEYDRSELDPMRALIKPRLMADGRERLRVVLFVAFSVFQILDRRDWTLEAAMRSTHPPAPARVKAAYAAALNLNLDGLTEKQLREDVQLAHMLSHAIMSVGFDTYPDLDWLGRLDDPGFNEFMLEVVRQVPTHMRA